MKSAQAINLVFTIALTMFGYIPSASTAGPLPLEPGGLYVESDLNCDEAVAHDMVTYNGGGFEYHRSWCTIVNVRHEGKAYHIKQECDNYPIGEGNISTLTEIIFIKDKTSFTLKRGKKKITYKLCK